MKGLTERQQEILDLIKDQLSNTGLPPTRADIARILGFKSPNAAEQHLRAIEKKGFIRTLLGGTFFGLGWGISGACAAPIFVILGFELIPAIILLLGALLGAFIYGLLSKKLPN